MTKAKPSSIPSGPAINRHTNPPLESNVVQLHPGGLNAAEGALQQNGAAAAAELGRAALRPEVTEKIKELVRLAQEQGYLTYSDIDEALPESVTSADEIERVIIHLRNLEVEIVGQAEVDRVKQPDDEEDEKTRLDILDDPVRMYLRQMGQVPLLSREQEIEISKRIEQAENEIKKIISSFGFAAKEHIALAEKLTQANGQTFLVRGGGRSFGQRPQDDS